MPPDLRRKVTRGGDDTERDGLCKAEGRAWPEPAKPANSRRIIVDKCTHSAVSYKLAIALGVRALQLEIVPTGGLAVSQHLLRFVSAPCEPAAANAAKSGHIALLDCCATIASTVPGQANSGESFAMGMLRLALRSSPDHDRHGRQDPLQVEGAFCCALQGL